MNDSMNRKCLSVIALTLFSMFFITSCSKDDPEPSSPTSADPRAQFYGNWSVSETSHDYGASTYSCTIADSTDGTHILLGYIYGFNKKAYATVSGNNFTVPVQLIQGNNVSGSGLLVSTNHMNVTYLVQSTSTHYDTVKAVFNK